MRYVVDFDIYSDTYCDKNAPSKVSPVLDYIKFSK